MVQVTGNSVGEMRTYDLLGTDARGIMRTGVIHSHMGVTDEVLGVGPS